MWRILCIAFALFVAFVSATIVTKGMASAVDSLELPARKAVAA